MSLWCQHNYWPQCMYISKEITWHTVLLNGEHFFGGGVLTFIESQSEIKPLVLVVARYCANDHRIL